MVVTMFFSLLLAVPSSPGQPVVISPGPTEATVEWAVSTATPTQPVDGYHVYLREKGKRAWKKVTKNIVKTTEHVITDLIPAQEYEVHITAVNQIGESAPSPTSKPFTQPSEITAESMKFLCALNIRGLKAECYFYCLFATQPYDSQQSRFYLLDSQRAVFSYR